MVSLLNDLSSEMILPILPFFITQLGGSGIAIGIISGMRESFTNILKIIFGYFSDRYKNRIFFIYTGYMTSSFFKIFLAFSQTWQHVLIITGLERLGKSIRTSPRDALIAQSAPNNRGMGFGIHKAFDTFGALLGSCIVFLLLHHWNITLTTIIVIASIIAFFSIIPLIFIKENKEEVEIISQKSLVTPSLGIIKTLSDKFKYFLCIASIFSLANISYMFIMLKTNSSFAKSSGLSTTMLLYIVFNAIHSLSAIPIGKISDSIGRWKMLVAGYSFFASTMIYLTLAKTMPQFLICFALYGISISLIEVNHKAYAADLAPANHRATTLGIFEAATGLATLLSGIIAGILWEFTGTTFIFIYASVLAACALGMLITLQKKLSPN